MGRFIIFISAFMFMFNNTSIAQHVDFHRESQKTTSDKKVDSETNEQIKYILEVTGQTKAIRQWMLTDYLNPLLLYSNNIDKASIDKIRNQLSEDEISKKLIVEFKRRFTGPEIKVIYDFSKSPAGNKYFSLNTTNQLTDLLKGSLESVKIEILRLKTNYSVNTDAPKSVYSADRPDGFYRVLNYNKASSFDDFDHYDYSKYELDKNASISTSDIESVKDSIIKEMFNRVVIDIVLTPEGALKFEKVTTENIGKPIAIVVNKIILSAPIINSAISGGKLQISGSITEYEAKAIVKKLQSQIEKR